MRKIFLDTNALMAIAEFKLDLFGQLERLCDFKYELVVLSGTLDELKKIMEEQRGKYKSAAKLALAIITAKIKTKDITKIDSFKTVDNELIELSKKSNLVLTQDQELKQKLTKPFLTIRQKKKIIVVD